MANPSLCTVQGLTPPQNVAASASVTIALINTAVDSWTITCTSTDELNLVATINAGLVVNQVAKTATYTQPSTASGSAVQFTSTVIQGGITSSSTFGVFVLNLLSTRLFFPGETNESSASFGVVSDLNAALRNTVSMPNATSSTSGGIILTHDLAGTYNAPLVVGIQGNPVQTATLGASQDGYVLTWKNGAGLLEFVPTNDTEAIAGEVTGTLAASVVSGPFSTSTLQWKNSVSAAVLGTNLSGATLALQSDAASAGLFLSKSDGYFGGTTAANSSLLINWNTSTTPIVQSGTAATSLTVGTNKSAATLVLQSDAAQTNITLASNSVTLGGSGSNLTTFTGGISDGYVKLTDNYTLDGYELDLVVLGNISVSKTLTLVQPSLNKGRTWFLKDIGGNLSSTVKWTLARFGSEKIEGVAASYVITTPFFSATLFCDGSNFYLL